MNIIAQGDTLILQKNGQRIGYCQFATPVGAGVYTGTAAFGGQCVPRVYQILQFEITPAWQRKGYGTFLLKDLLRRTGGYDAKQETTYRVALPCAGQVMPNFPAGAASQQVPSREAAQAGTPFPAAFFAKFGFVPSGDGTALIRHKKPDLTAISLVQRQIYQHLGHPAHAAQGGDSAPLCIDATCGNGHDALFLAQCMPADGQLLALDIQPEAIAQTAQRLQRANIPAYQYTLHCADHANLAQYAAPESADVIVFNFGWLPGADHDVFSNESSSIPALASALELLKPGGLLCATLYSGVGIGDAEKTAILTWLQALPIDQYTVLTCNFANWAPTAPLPCFVFKK